jgi:hypothetical protein
MATYIEFQHQILMERRPLPMRSAPRMILCMGDCFMKGCQHRTAGWPYYLSTFLMDNVEVWNGAIGLNAGTYCQALFHRFLVGLNPDLVIFQPMLPAFAPITKEEKELFKRCDDQPNEHKTYSNLCASALRQKIGDRIHREFLWVKKHRSNRLPLRFYKRLENDLSWIEEIVKNFDCPTLYLVNRFQHPYYRYADKAINRIQNELKKTKDRLLVTEFRGPEYQLDGFHPNDKRDRLTAIEVCTEIVNHGWIVDWAKMNLTESG